MANVLQVILKGDAKHLNNSLRTTSRSLKNFGNRMKSIGSSLQTRLTLPLVAAGGASIKMAADFDKSMTQIKTLVGIAGGTVDQMSESVKTLASASGVSAGEAADALFFITSAGLRGAEAMAVLEQSTKAAAIGLGETKVVADLATSALNAYGVENLSASQATDVLTGAVREGKLSADTLAQSMGTVLPVASQLGVQFSEVGATFAAMSRTGTDAAMAATQIRGILFALLKPTSQAKDTLKEFNLSAAGLREQIREKGLLSTLKTLTETFGDNEEAQGKVFANTRALSGVLDLMGKNLGSTEKIFESMNNTTGITEKAFDKLSDSASFKLGKALNELKNEFSSFGGILLESLLPAIRGILGIASKLFNAFGKLDPVVQQIAIGFAALAAVLPTILTVGGSLLTLIAALTSPIGLVVAGIALLALWFNEISNVINDFTVDIKTGLLNALVKVQAGFEKFLVRIETATAVIRAFLKDGFDADYDAIFETQATRIEGISKKAGEEIKKNLDTSEVVKKFNDLPPTMEVISKKAKEMFGDLFSSAGIKAPKVKAPVIEKPAKQPDLFDIFKADDSKLSPTVDFKTNKADYGQLEKITDPLTSLANSPSWGILSDKIATTSDKVSELTDNRLKNLEERSMAVGAAVGGAFNDMGSNMLASLDLADNGFEGFVKNLGGTIIDLISQMLAASIAQSIAGATASGTATGPAAVFTTPAFIATAVGGVMSAFAAIPKFANGGIVSAPTLGLMGEYAGARSNPEVIAPLDRLKGMIGQRDTAVNVTGGFRLEGQDLVVALQRAERNRSRL